MRLFICLMCLILSSCTILQPQFQTRKRNISVKNVPVGQNTNIGEPRKRILVLPFLDADPVRNSKIKTIARRVIVKELISTRQFIVLRNSDFPKDLSQFVNEKNEYNLKEISKIASGMGITAILEGKLLTVDVRKIGDSVGLIRKIKTG